MQNNVWQKELQGSGRNGIYCPACLGNFSLIVTPKDVFDLAEVFKCTVNEIVSEFITFNAEPKYRIPIMELKRCGSSCILLKDKCIAGVSRPSVCTVINRFSIARIGDANKSYFTSECSGNQYCSRISSTFRVNRDAAYLEQWLQTVNVLNSKLTIFGVSNNTEWNKFVGVVIDLCYLRYSTKFDFEEQYQDNLSELLALIE